MALQRAKSSGKLKILLLGAAEVGKTGKSAHHYFNLILTPQRFNFFQKLTTRVSACIEEESKT